MGRGSDSRGVGREKKSGTAHLPRAELWDPRRGSPTAGGSGGAPLGKFLNLDCKSLILSTSRGDTNYQQTEYFYGFLDSKSLILTTCQNHRKYTQIEHLYTYVV